MSHAGTWGLATMLMAVAGCAISPQMRLEPVLAVTRQSFELPDKFLLKARVSVRQDQRVDSFALEWTRALADGVTHDSMRVLTPFGSQVAELTSTPTMAVLVQGKQRTQADHVGALTEGLLGVAVTPAQLLVWLQQPSTQTLDGWQVTSDRFSVFSGISLAMRVTAVRGDQVVRVVLDDFSAQ